MGQVEGILWTLNLGKFFFVVLGMCLVVFRFMFSYQDVNEEGYEKNVVVDVHGCR